MVTHKDLRVWQQSIDLVTSVYLLTKNYPKEELFGLVSQMRRAVVSIPSNIAEGYARGTDKEKLHFLRISSGSMSELETQVMVSHNLGYMNLEERNAMLEDITSIWKQLNALITALKRRQSYEDLPFRE